MDVTLRIYMDRICWIWVFCVAPRLFEAWTRWLLYTFVCLFFVSSAGPTDWLCICLRNYDYASTLIFCQFFKPDLVKQLNNSVLTITILATTTTATQTTPSTSNAKHPTSLCQAISFRDFLSPFPQNGIKSSNVCRDTPCGGASASALNGDLFLGCMCCSVCFSWY